MLPNSVRVVVPKKGKKKKVVKLGPCGDKAVAGTKFLQVVHRVKALLGGSENRQLEGTLATGRASRDG